MLKAKKTSREDIPQMQEALEQVTKEPTMRINVDVPLSLHTEIKILAAHQKTSIKDIIISCLNEYLSKNSKTH